VGSSSWETRNDRSRRSAIRSRFTILLYSRGLPPSGSTRAGSRAGTDEGSSRFQIGFSSVSCRWQWRDRHRLRQSIEDQFQPADVAAVDTMGFRPITLVADLGLARRALPRWTRRTLRGRITVARALIHARGESNQLAASLRTNPGHFAAAVSLFSSVEVSVDAARSL
jgi:hypothetical protein